MDSAAISAWISAFGLIFTAISVWVALMEFRREHKWNRSKASEETLSKLVLGEFPESLDKMVSLFQWDPINGDNTYVEVSKTLNEKELLELDLLLRRLLRILETLFIHVKHGVLDEDICYDYLASMVPNFYQRCKKFIEKERHQRGDSRVFENFAGYAHAWMQRNSSFKSQQVQSLSIRGKRL